MSMRKVLIVENSVDITGAFMAIFRAAIALKESFEFIFVIPEQSRTISRLQREGFTVVTLPMKELRKDFFSVLLYAPRLIANALRLRRIVRNYQVDFIHGNDLYNLLPVALRILDSRVRYACHVRFMPDKFPKALFNAWLRLHFQYAEHIIAVSKSLLSKLPEHSKIQLIYDGVAFDRNVTNLTTSVQPARRFLYLSNFMQGKGQDYAVKAFARVENKLPGWKLRFVGGDMGLDKNRWYREALGHKANTLNIADKIEWAPFTENVEYEYMDADIVLNFSESESFSLTCVEAMYFGKPVIATNSGGPAEIIEHSVSGVLVNNRDIDAMSHAMMRLANNAQLRDVMGREASRSVAEKFAISITAEKLSEIFK